MIIGISGKKQHGKDTVAKIIQYLAFDRRYKGHGHNFQSFSEESSGWRKLESTWETKQFAGKLKQVVALLIGCTVEQLEDNTFKEKVLPDQWKKWCIGHPHWHTDNNPGGRISRFFTSQQEAIDAKNNLSVEELPNIVSEAYIAAELLSPRRILQLMGTEAGRNIIHPNIWINALMADYKKPVLGRDIEDGNTYDVKGEYPNWIITDVRFPNEVEAIKEKGGLVFRVNRPMYAAYYRGYNEPIKVSYNREEIYSMEREATYGENREIKDKAVVALPYENQIDTHPSETALDSYTEWDGIILNSDMQSLIGQVQNYLHYYKIIEYENSNR